MSTLTLTSQPGFSEVPDSAFDAGNPVTAANMKSMNAASKFAAVRDEEFWGYYKHGETVQAPLSPADGYAYALEELRYTWSVYWTGTPPGTALEGTQTPPSRGATGGSGQLLQMGFNVDQETGVVACDVSYYRDGGSQTDTQ
ncbi:hypothetical protein LCGC14_3140660, partial [marine sediment metagenome]